MTKDEKQVIDQATKNVYGRLPDIIASVKDLVDVAPTGSQLLGESRHALDVLNNLKRTCESKTRLL